MRELIKKGFLGKINYSTIEHHTNMIDEKIPKTGGSIKKWWRSGTSSWITYD